MQIYVASSWRNLLQPAIVHALRRCGHEVHDFRHPKPGDNGFSWSDVGAPDYSHGQLVEPELYRKMMTHPRAIEGYRQDVSHLISCDAVVAVMPFGRSASWELGYAMGQGKPGYLVCFGLMEPELMFSEAKLLTHINDLFDAFGEPFELPSND